MNVERQRLGQIRMLGDQRLKPQRSIAFERCKVRIQHGRQTLLLFDRETIECGRLVAGNIGGDGRIG
ncbi:MAG: hypothetical protein R3C99_05100 [Pirellulaceae bacterium]